MISAPSLPTVSLDELNSTAALQSRTDRKYLLPDTCAQQMADDAPHGTRTLEISGKTVFRYDSVYFDTRAHDLYFATAKGRARRAKVRVRHYVDTGAAFLEVKVREGKQTVKRRIEHDPSRIFSINPDQHSFIIGCLDAGGIRTLRPDWLNPVLQTSYLRRTFLAPGGASRVTVDEDLSWQLIGGGCIRRPNMVIVETKTASHISVADRWLWHNGHRPLSISKYATGLAALNPFLPANRWHRVLNNYFRG